MGTKRQPWPKHANNAADDIAFGLSEVRKQAGAVGRMAVSIGDMADAGIDMIRSGDETTLTRLLLDIRRMTGAQQTAAATIDNAAGLAIVVLAGARVGEYGE